jgi:hypothetical protein
MQVKELVLGTNGGNNPIQIGGNGSAIFVPVPLVIQAQGENGKIGIQGDLTGTVLEIYGPGNTTTFTSGTVTMTEGMPINDSVRIVGSVNLAVGAPGAAADILVSGRLNGSTGDDDQLDLSAQGGDITIQGSVGDGIGTVSIVSAGTGLTDGVYGDGDLHVGLSGGSGTGATARVTVRGGVVTEVRLFSPGKGYQVGDLLTFNQRELRGALLEVTGINDLEGLTVSTARNVTFGDKIYVDGDVTITATGKVVFSDSVILRGGGQLFIHDAAAVEFLGGVKSETGEPVLVFDANGTGSSLSFSGGLMAGASDTVTFTGVNSLELASAIMGQSLPSLVIEGRDLGLTPAAGGSTIRLDVAALKMTGQTLAWPTAGMSQVRADDLQLNIAQGVGSPVNPLEAVVKTLSASSQSGDLFLRHDGDVTLVREGLSVREGAGGISLQVSGSLELADRSAVSTSTGDIHLQLGGDLGMAAGSTMRTDSGDISVTAGGNARLHQLRSASGDIDLQVQQSVTVTDPYGTPQVVTDGHLSLSAGTGIGGYLYDRLYVDVHSISVHNGEYGDVVISGREGLNVLSAHSDSQNGWMLLMSGMAGLVTGSSPTAQDHRVARISGKTILSEGVLPVRSLHDANIHFMRNPQSEALAPLQDFNARLAREWSARLDAESALDRLDSRPTELSSELRQLLGSRTHAMPFSASVMPDTGSRAVTSALLEAALRMAPMVEAEDVFGADMLSSWAQRSYESRLQRVSVESDADDPSSVAAVPPDLDPRQSFATTKAGQPPQRSAVEHKDSDTIMESDFDKTRFDDELADIGNEPEPVSTAE